MRDFNSFMESLDETSKAEPYQNKQLDAQVDDILAQNRTDLEKSVQINQVFSLDLLRKYHEWLFSGEK